MIDGANDGPVDVLVGYLVTHADGYEARIGPDRTRAELYAARNRAMLEPMFVRRHAARQDGAECAPPLSAVIPSGIASRAKGPAHG